MADEEERRRRSYAKELPPITLSTTSISGLVTLIPVLVSLTSQGQSPRFDDENDKPVWWPLDIQWRNPKSYSYMGDSILEILRRVVHSCYSYHGVEDLLCRLDETPFSDSGEEINMVDLTETNFLEDDCPASCSPFSTESDNLVFVCCFCLEEFSSHNEVTSHQNLCHQRSQSQSDKGESDVKSSSESDNRESQSKKLPNPSHKHVAAPYPVSLHVSNGLSGSCHLPSIPPKLGCSEAAAGDNCSSSVERSSTCVKPKAYSSSVKSVNNVTTTSTTKKQQPPPSSSFKFIPTLKTRSQKKLDQIMEKHNSRKLMLSECRRIKGLEEKGAWWMRKQRRKICASTVHPSCIEVKESFLSHLGLTLKVNMEAQAKDLEKTNIDLDCEIILVEGPLSGQAVKQETGSSSVSPRGSRSLMSQLSRDSDVASRRRLSFCFVDDEWADKEALEEGRDPLQMSLLTIAPSSPLGQRIKKYARADGPLSIIKDPEMYSKTENKDDNHSRLRFRSVDYRVTYRKKCRASTYVHMYKFNRSNVQEFKTRLQTGLTLRSRRLLRSMKSLRVMLKRLSKKEIKSWTEEKRVSITENIVYDEDLCLTQIEVPESKVRGYLASAAAPGLQQHSNSKGPHPRQQQQHPSHQHHRHRHHHRPHSHNHHQPQSMYSSGSMNNFNHLSSQKVPSGLSPSLYLSHSSSPPHVPNIFRNKSSNSASSSQMPSKTHHLNHNNPKPSFIGQPSFYKDNKTSEQTPQVSKPQLKGANMSDSSAGFSSGFIITGQRPLTPNSNSNSSGRRKQAMNQVRRDEQDINTGNPPKGSSFSNSLKSVSGGGFVKLSTYAASMPKACSSSSGSSASLSSSRLSQSHPNRNNTQYLMGPEVPKLSNFEYLSIREGLLSVGHSLSDNSSKRKNSQRSQPPQGTPSNHSTSSSSGLPDGRTSSPAIPTQNRMSSGVSLNSTNRTNHSNANSRPPPNPNSQSSDSLRKLHQHKEQNHLAAPQRMVKPLALVDDDVLEVICIDD